MIRAGLYDNCRKQNLKRALKAYRTAEEKGGLDVRLLTALQVLQVRRTG